MHASNLGDEGKRELLARAVHRAVVSKQPPLGIAVGRRTLDIEQVAEPDVEDLRYLVKALQAQRDMASLPPGPGGDGNPEAFGQLFLGQLRGLAGGGNPCTEGAQERRLGLAWHPRMPREGLPPHQTTSGLL